MKKSNQLEDNIYLAKIVSFDSFTLLVDTNEYEMPFEFEDYRFVVAIGPFAYDLIDGSRYHIIDMEEGIIPDDELNTLVAHKKYVYDMYPFSQVWNRLESIMNGDIDFVNFINQQSMIMEEKHEHSAHKCEIIDFQKVKKLKNDQKK